MKAFVKLSKNIYDRSQKQGQEFIMISLKDLLEMRKKIKKQLEENKLFQHVQKMKKLENEKYEKECKQRFID